MLNIIQKVEKMHFLLHMFFQNCCQLVEKLFDMLFTQSRCHTPPEGLCGSEKSSRLMTFTQPFYGISGTQNRKNQNFLTRTFSVIAILRYPTFPYCFYYIAILQLSHFREIFTIFLAVDTMAQNPHNVT